ncbi:MAG: endonuclease/exonuclease/phosphatase family protein [Candidatus Daviesbacteria bacterium]|nr:endonuclease/exonuclease/phosphatase family protein [Candidatus Daviesbacteria bacterium]
MKLISLNTWGGKIYQPLVAFIKNYSRDSDIFCFQEIYNTTTSVKQFHNIRANLLEELKQILPDFQVFYTPEFSGYDSNPNPVDFDLTVGEATFIRKDINVHSFEKLPISGDGSEKILKTDFSNFPVALQCINLIIDNKSYIICNIHGTSFPGSKLDTKQRLEQSMKINNFLKRKSGAKILTGDLNLLPQTESIKILERDMKNLIKQFNIEKTRSDLSPYFKKPGFQKFADYIFVSPDVNVKSFEVPEVEISDHLPMILEFS